MAKNFSREMEMLVEARTRLEIGIVILQACITDFNTRGDSDSRPAALDRFSFDLKKSQLVVVEYWVKRVQENPDFKFSFHVSSHSFDNSDQIFLHSSSI